MSEVYTDSVAILSAATATGAGEKHNNMVPERSFQALGSTSSGAGAAVIDIEVSNVSEPSADTEWITLGTISLTLGTTVTSDGFASDAAWRHVRANVTSISGTGASVDVHMGA